jgi:hypothetical protein
MNLGGVDVGKVVGAQGDNSKGGDGAGTNTSKDMVKVFCGKKVVGLIWRAGEVASVESTETAVMILTTN